MCTLLDCLELVQYTMLMYTVFFLYLICHLFRFQFLIWFSLIDNINIVIRAVQQIKFYSFTAAAHRILENLTVSKCIFIFYFIGLGVTIHNLRLIKESDLRDIFPIPPACNFGQKIQFRENLNQWKRYNVSFSCLMLLSLLFILNTLQGFESSAADSYQIQEIGNSIKDWLTKFTHIQSNNSPSCSSSSSGHSPCLSPSPLVHTEKKSFVSTN